MHATFKMVTKCKNAIIEKLHKIKHIFMVSNLVRSFQRFHFNKHKQPTVVAFDDNIHWFAPHPHQFATERSISWIIHRELT